MVSTERSAAYCSLSRSRTCLSQLGARDSARWLPWRHVSARSSSISPSIASGTCHRVVLLGLLIQPERQPDELPRSKATGGAHGCSVPGHTVAPDRGQLDAEDAHEHVVMVLGMEFPGVVKRQSGGPALARPPFVGFAITPLQDQTEVSRLVRVPGNREGRRIDRFRHPDVTDAALSRHLPIEHSWRELRFHDLFSHQAIQLC